MATYRVRYPSGKRLTLQGTWRGILGTPQGDLSCVEQDDGQMVVLDPRGVVVDRAAKVVVYHPRHEHQLTVEMRGWLAEHPEWAPLPR